VQVLSYDDLKAKGIRFSRQWIIKLVAAGKFPQSISLGDRSGGFTKAKLSLGSTTGVGNATSSLRLVPTFGAFVATIHKRQKRAFGSGWFLPALSKAPLE
jgi:hypothetical protein